MKAGVESYKITSQHYDAAYAAKPVLLHLSPPSSALPSRRDRANRIFAFLTAESAGALGVITGVLAQLAAIGLILIMLGAMRKKIFVWHTGFWGKSESSGWSYDTMIVTMNLVIATTGGAISRL